MIYECVLSLVQIKHSVNECEENIGYQHFSGDIGLIIDLLFIF